MLECTWNDTEAEFALRRLLLKEQKKEKQLADDPQLRHQLRESALSRLAPQRAASVDAPAGD